MNNSMYSYASYNNTFSALQGIVGGIGSIFSAFNQSSAAQAQADFAWAQYNNTLIERERAAAYADKMTDYQLSVMDRANAIDQRTMTMASNQSDINADRIRVATEDAVRNDNRVTSLKVGEIKTAASTAGLAMTGTVSLLMSETIDAGLRQSKARGLAGAQQEQNFRQEAVNTRNLALQKEEELKIQKNFIKIQNEFRYGK